MIIGITGTNGAGKGVVVEYLVQQKQYVHFSSSGYLADELTRLSIEHSRTNLRNIGNEFRKKFGSGYLVKMFLERKEKEGIENVIIESIRSTGEAKKLKEGGGKLLVIDANRAKRYERIFARKSGKDLIDFNTFVEQEEREWYGKEGEHDMNMQGVMHMADYTILNNGSLEELHSQIETFLKTIAN